jgi:NADH-quinone oxidoreductase subunit I
MRVTSPSGSSAYEGRVNWSGELGFGVRAPDRGQSDAVPSQADDHLHFDEKGHDR